MSTDNKQVVAVRFCKRENIPAEDMAKAIGQCHYYGGICGSQRWQGNLYDALIFLEEDEPPFGWPYNYGHRHRGTLEDVLEGADPSRTRMKEDQE